MNKIGLAGFGFVGQALYASAKNISVIYDPPKSRGNLNELVGCSHIFCCLPSPPNKYMEQDFSIYEEFLTSLVRARYLGIVIIKSTVLFSNIEKFLSKLKIVMNPEFLNQNTSIKDFINQKTIILGGEIDDCLSVADLYKKEFSFLVEPTYEFCSIKEAIQIKYMHNIYHAYKVLFWNYVLEVTDNHRKIFSLYSKITGNTFEMQNVGADGRLGYGGACFPKDVGAFDVENPHELTKFMQEYNTRLRKNIKKHEINNEDHLDIL